MAFWQTERLRLRQTQSDDGDFFYALNQEPEMSRFLDYLQLPTTLEHERRWAGKNAAKDREGDKFYFMMLGRTLPDEPRVGFIDVHTADRRNGTFMYGIGVHRDFRGRGYAADAIWLVLHYYFTELRYQKCTVGVHATNPASIALHERFGFVQEGRTRRTNYTDGQLIDELVYGMTVEEFLAK